MKLLPRIWPVILAALLTYSVGTIISSQFVLNAYNIQVDLGVRVSSAVFDLKGMYAYFIIIFLGFLIAFPIAALLKRRVSPRVAILAYPLAGAVAIGAALAMMYLQFDTIPISGAKSLTGYFAQVVCGGLGGWAFARLIG